MSVKPSSNVTGASKNIKHDSSTIIFRGNINFGMEQNAQVKGLTNSFEKVGSCEKCDGPTLNELERIYKYADLNYNFKVELLSFLFEYLHKEDLFTIGFRVGYDNGAYISPILGINSKYFELGSFVSLGFTSVEKTQSGHSYICDQSCFLFFCSDYEYKVNEDFEETTNFVTTFFSYGIYASIYYDLFSFNFSSSLKYPNNGFIEDIEDEGDFFVSTTENYLPLVITNRYSLGYFFSKNWRIFAGAIQVYGDFKGLYWFGFGGIEWNI